MEIRQALTFDDVMLVPAASGDHARRDGYPHPPHPRDRARHPAGLGGDGHGDRKRARDRDGAGRRDRRHPPQHGESSSRPTKSARSRNSRPGWSSTRSRSTRTRRLADALRLMADHKISGIPVVERGSGQARRHPDQPRRAIRRRPAPAGRRADDQGRARHGARECRARRRKAPAAPASHRKAARRRRGLSLRRPDHRQGHREGAALSDGLQGRARPSARRCGDRYRQRGHRARRGAVRRRSRRHGRRHRARSFRPGIAHVERDPPAVELHPGHRRQCRDGGGRAGLDRGGRRRDQGRHRPGLDLHDPHGRRGRRAAIHRDRRHGRRMPQDRRAGDRRRRHQVFRRPRQGDRRRGRLRDARLAVRRHRREPGRGLPLSGPQLQILPRHGLDRGDGARLGRPLFPAGSDRAP